MADEDIFGKIDALLEKRAGFGATHAQAPPEDEFPVLTEVVAPRMVKSAPLPREPSTPSPSAHKLSGRADDSLTLSEEQLNRFMSQLERKLEDLFIRQQLRLEEAIRRALQRSDTAQGKGGKNTA